MPRATTPVELTCLRNASNLEQLEEPWLMLMASKESELVALSMRVFGLSMMKMIREVWVEEFAGIHSPMTPAGRGDTKVDTTLKSVSTYSHLLSSPEIP